MSLQEKKALVNILSSILITGAYAYYIFILHADDNAAYVNDLKFWARFILVLIPVSIVSKIVVHIIFTIANTIITREKDPDIRDEFDRLIELKSMRNGNFIFIFGFLASMLFVLFDEPVSSMFVVLVVGGLLGDVFGEFCKIYYYRKGIR